ncbi:MAG: hypothetical protein ACI9FB_004075 [Candidatus Azotimanducaceae bacterium]|jgi:hypothetical protein
MRFTMSKIDEKADELIAKHPNLTKLEAIKIVTEKNERKKNKKTEKADKSKAKRLAGEAKRPDPE